ncbi:hypothetical protein HAX54_045832, partial [Datura stramonium]|nr:hypothetical protein [Datura stramonium]
SYCYLMPPKGIIRRTPRPYYYMMHPMGKICRTPGSYYYMMAHKGKICRTLPSGISSNLPENVIDEILLCLPFKDAVRTSILSKKWRYNWCKLPVLTLDEPVWKSKKGVTFRPSKITQIISHILILHTGPITKFILCVASWTSCPNIDDLIYFLSRNGIQHLVLTLPSMDNLYKLPSSLFTCLQLRHLTLENCLVFLPPDFRGFDRLISLKLCDVTISNEFLESLISGIRSICFKSVPCMAKLSLSHRGYSGVPGENSIAKFFESFSALQHLHLDEDSIELGDGHDDTPALECLEVDAFQM